MPFTVIKSISSVVSLCMLKWLWCYPFSFSHFIGTSKKNVLNLNIWPRKKMKSSSSPSLQGISMCKCFFSAEIKIFEWRLYIKRKSHPWLNVIVSAKIVKKVSASAKAVRRKLPKKNMLKVFSAKVHDGLGVFIWFAY